jgi:hypothetical protein
LPLKESIMAARFVALLIPLAITLPQLQTSRVAAPEPPRPAPLAQPAADAEWSYETRHIAIAALPRIAVQSPVHDAVRALDGAAAEPVVVAAAPAVLAVVPAHVRQAAPKRAAPRLARAASPVKLVSAAPAPGRSAKRRPADAGCLPGAHCAPVVVAKVTPVNRRPL